MVDEYHKKSDDYAEENVKNQRIDNTFAKIDVKDRNVFLQQLRNFQANNPRFLTNILNQEFASKFWK